MKKFKFIKLDPLKILNGDIILSFNDDDLDDYIIDDFVMYDKLTKWCIVTQEVFFYNNNDSMTPMYNGTGLNDKNNIVDYESRYKTHLNFMDINITRLFRDGGLTSEEYFDFTHKFTHAQDKVVLQMMAVTLLSKYIKFYNVEHE